jgi:phosphomannomutase/phosphoglucomutase
MYDEIEKNGGKAVMYKTGHSNIKVKMNEINANLACEVSGHIFFKDRYFGFDDAIYATLRVLELLKQGVDLEAELKSLPKLFSTDELKVQTTDEAKFTIIENIKEQLKNPPENFPAIKDIIDIDGLRINFENGWALVRASNTTPVLVTRFEAKSKEDLERYQEVVKELIKKAKELQ